MLEESVSPDPSHVRLITSQGHWEKKKRREDSFCGFTGRSAVEVFRVDILTIQNT